MLGVFFEIEMKLTSGVTWTIGNILKWNFDKNVLKIFIEQNAFENVDLIMWASLFRNRMRAELNLFDFVSFNENN